MRMRVFIIAILASLSLVSCTAEIGNPIAASYEVKSLESDDFAYFYLSLDEDGSFILIGSGGNASSEAYVISGSYSFTITSFDFIKGSGSVNFMVDDIPDDITGMAMSEGNNNYTFYWQIDRNSGARTMDFDPVTDASKVLSRCYEISDERFASIYESVKGGSR